MGRQEQCGALPLSCGDTAWSVPFAPPTQKIGTPGAERAMVGRALCLAGL